MASSRINTIAPADKAKIIILVMLIAALPLAVLYVMVADWIEQLFAGARAQLFGQVLVAILLESLPFVLLGVIVSGVLEVFVPPDRLARLVPRNRVLRLLAAAGLGVVLPVCNCGIVPVGRRLIRKGLPLEMAVVYMLAGPIINPIVIASTAVAFAGQGLGLWMPVARVLCGLAVAMVVGVAVTRWGGTMAVPASDHDSHSVAGHIRIRTALPRIVHCVVQDFVLLGGYLLLGSFVAAAFHSFVPRDALLSFDRTPVLGTAGMMVMAFAMNLCSEADAFVAATFGQFTLAARLAFLVFGPMLSFRMAAMYAGAMPRRMVVVMILVAAPLVLAACELAGWLLSLLGN
jgi:uncharacterized protein